MARRPQKMDTETLQSIVKFHINNATGARIGSDGGGDLVAEREKALKYYNGEPFGNEVEGRSKVVSRDVAEIIDSLLPSLLEIFMSGDDVVRFDPTGPEDEEYAKQATDYVNHIFQRENDGFQNMHDGFKDALLEKLGVWKIYWEERKDERAERYRGLTEEEYQKLLQDDDLTVDEVETYDEMVIDPMSGAELPMPLYDCKVVRTEQIGRVRVEAIPPEEFLVSRRAVKLEDERGRMIVPFVCHRVKKTISDLIAEGFSFDEVKDIPSAYEGEFNEQRNIRHDDDDIIENNVIDASMREVWLHECYLRVDTDGDGIAETRKVLVGGNGHTILSNEEVAEQPFVTMTPIPTPHALIGSSVADQLYDVQELNSTLWRQALDNAYNLNNARAAVNERVDLDTLLNNAVGGHIVVEGNEPVGNSIQWQQSPSLLNHIMPLMEHADQVKERRTGVSRLNQGLDPDALNDTATGVNLIMGAGQKRQLLIARIFAQTGVRDGFRKILRLITMYQDKPKMIRLRNTFVEMDPSKWSPLMDVSVNVGLGYGNRDQQLMARRQILEIQRGVVEMQQGYGDLVGPEHVSHAVRKFVEAAGEQNPDAWFADITPEKSQEIANRPPPPNPEAEKMQAEMQMEQQKLQMDQQAKQAEMSMKAQSEERAAQVDMMKVQAQMEMEREQHRHRIQMEREKAQADIQIAREKAAAEMALKRDQAQAQAQINAYSAEQKADAQRETASNQGD